MAGYQFQNNSLDHICPKKGKLEKCIHTGGIYIHQMPGIHLLAWQAHYDLKDPKGLAGFLIDSDIKLVRAEWGSPDESSRHKS